MKNYITGIRALALHGYDWHKTSIGENVRYPSELSEWESFGIDGNIANPVRAYLDYVLYVIRYKKAIPTRKPDDFLFDETEVKTIRDMLERKLKPNLQGKELEIYYDFITYLDGGEYAFDKNETRKRRLAYRRAKSTPHKIKGEPSHFETLPFSIYDIDTLAQMKLEAMKNRTVARDLYDIAIIANEYIQELSPETIEAIHSFFNGKEAMEIAIDWEEAFLSDGVLKESDLFKSIMRLSEFFEKGNKLNRVDPVLNRRPKFSR